MKAMILAAGRGERMRPLTDTCPKPLLKAGNDSLIGWHLKRLKAAGFTDIVINHAWLGHLIEATLGDGYQYGVSIQYSAESAQGLETAGGIATALPLLGDAPFLVINGDTLTDIPFETAHRLAQQLNATEHLAHLWLVPNPEHNPQGDFLLDGHTVRNPISSSDDTYTFSGTGIYHPQLFINIPRHQPAKLAPVLRHAIQNHQVSGSLHQGKWLDVGTPQRLDQATEWVKHPPFTG